MWLTLVSCSSLASEFVPAQLWYRSRSVQFWLLLHSMQSPCCVFKSTYNWVCLTFWGFWGVDGADKVFSSKSFQVICTHVLGFKEKPGVHPSIYLKCTPEFMFPLPMLQCLHVRSSLQRETNRWQCWSIRWSNVDHHPAHFFTNES